MKNAAWCIARMNINAPARHKQTAVGTKHRRRRCRIIPPSKTTSAHTHQDAKSPWPTSPAIPHQVLSDRTPTGPLYRALLAAFRVKSSSPWRTFNFDNPKMRDANVAVIDAVRSSLTESGHLRPFRVHIDGSVARNLGDDEAVRLGEIVRRFGGTVVAADEAARGDATHVVGYDAEEHDAPSVLEGEAERRAGGRPEPRTYLKTLTTAEFDTSEITGSKDGEGGTTRMALVHWWYHPPSTDEWLPVEDVRDGATGEVKVEDELPGCSKKGLPAVVGCKFIRDVELYNEWGMEGDYAIDD